MKTKKFNWKISVLVIIEIFFWRITGAQTNQVDSLLNIISISREDTTKLSAMVRLAKIYSESNYDSASVISKEAIALAGSIIKAGKQNVLEDSTLLNKYLADAYHIVSNMELVKANYSESLKNSLKNLSLSESIHDENRVAVANCNIGIAFMRMQNNNQNALDYFRKSLGWYIQSGNKKEASRQYNNIGAVYVNEKKYDSAFFYLKKTLRLKYEIGEPGGLARCLNNIAVLYSDYNGDSSLHYYYQALSVVKTTSDKHAACAIYQGLGEQYAVSGDIVIAVKYIDSSMALAKEIHSLNFIQANYSTLSNLYEKKKDYKTALEYSHLFKSYYDSMLNESNQQAMAEMETKYQAQKKGNEINLLNKDKKLNDAELARQRAIKSSIIGGAIVLFLSGITLFYFYKRRRDAVTKKKEAELNSHITEVEMKVLRAQMNPHFIFNSLRSINEYIQHNKSSLASEYLIKFSKLMRLILDNSRKKEVTIANDIEVLELYMQLESQRLEHPFSYTLEIDPSIDQNNTLIPPMLLQPIVENSIWHGIAPKNKPGKIIIRIKKQQEIIVCEIEDDGVGREVSLMMNKADESKQESYGLKIIQERLSIIEQVKKINTRFTFRDLNGSENTSGLNISFILPFIEAV